MNQQPEFNGPDEKGALGVRHLKRFRAQSLAKRNGRQSAPKSDDWRFDNLVLNGLGLSLEETICSM
jgi:hypothetical protein